MFDGAPPRRFVLVWLCRLFVASTWHGHCDTFPLRPQNHVRPSMIALNISAVRRWGNQQGRSLKHRHDASALRPKSIVRRPGNRIILAYVLTRWLAKMDPARRGVMRQHFWENVVLVAAPNEGTPEEHGSAIYLSQPVWKRRRRLSPVYAFFALHLASPGS